MGGGDRWREGRGERRGGAEANKRFIMENSFIILAVYTNGLEMKQSKCLSAEFQL